MGRSVGSPRNRGHPELPGNCRGRAEQADRDASRQQWLLAADTWQLAIEFKARVDHLTAEWASIKSVAAGKAISADRSQDRWADRQTEMTHYPKTARSATRLGDVNIRCRASTNGARVYWRRDRGSFPRSDSFDYDLDSGQCTLDFTLNALNLGLEKFL
jgi:hypothetical protein